MNSSGIKRGLAATAISALAVTGLPALTGTASAVPIEDQVTGVDLVSQYTGGASLRPDGTDSTVRLEAGGDENVTNITFYYQQVDAAGDPVGPAPQVIATVGRNDDGAFSFEWAGAAAFINGSVDLYAASTDAEGNLVEADGDPIVDGSSEPVPATDHTSTAPVAGAVVDTQQDVDIHFGESVNVTSGTTKGVYQAPGGAGGTGQYVGVTGTTSNKTQDVEVSWYDGTAWDTPVPANVPAATATQDPTTPGTFDGVIDITGYTYSVDGSADEFLVGAETGTDPDDSDDVESYTLYRQELGSVTAESDSANASAANPADVTVTVLDTTGQPIAGAVVYSSNAAASNPDSDTTDANGQAFFEQTGGTAYYYVNNTATGGYQASVGDERSADVAVTLIEPAASTLVARSNDGPAFDFDEYNGYNADNATGAPIGTPINSDITVQVKDQAGDNYNTDGQTLQYYWVLTPFDGTPATKRIPATGTWTATEEGTGKYDIEFPQGEEDGTYELFASLTANPGTGTGGLPSSKLLTVKAGDSDIVFDEANETAEAGTSEDVTGALELADGTGLAGRRIKFDYAATGGTDTSPDAGIVPASGTGQTSSRTIETGADGSFSIVVRDKSETPQGTETGTLTATTLESDLDNDNAIDDGNANETATQSVVFASSTPPAGSKVTISAITAGTDIGKPGVAESGTVTIVDAAGVPVQNQVVTLTVDGSSFFTNGEYEGTEKVGDDVGNLVSLGQSITLVTDSNGVASFQVAVERSEEFDDDGLAEDIITATAGSVSDTEDVDYSSANPLNGGEVDLVLSPADEQDGPTDPAPVGNDVAFDVFTTDQFGNLVGGETVTVNEDGDDATLSGDADTATPGFQVVSDFRSEGDFTLTSTDDDTVTVTATWTTDTTKFAADNTNTPADADTDLDQVSGAETLSDSETVTFDNVTITDESVSMTRTPEGDRLPVGTAVTETVTVLDDNGNPVPGVQVEFTRTGPGGSEQTVTRTTNGDGQAFYTFVGSEEGDAFITAVVQTGGTPVVENDSVTFGEKINPGLVVRGRNNGARDDNVVARAINLTAGATVRLFRKTENGLKLLRTSTMNSKGNHKFTGVNDKNGRKYTKYVVKVSATEETKRGRGAKRIR